MALADRTPRPSGRTSRRHHGPLLILMTIFMILFAAACSSAGSVEGGPATSSGTADNAVVQAADSTMISLKAGTYQAPPTTGPRAVKGKTVWVVSCGQTTDCAIEAQGVVDASHILGWNTRVCDGQNDENNAYSTCVEQAVSAHASGIITLSIDCSVIKSALLAAKAAHIPVVNDLGFDCSEDTPPSGPSLFAAEVQQSAKAKTTREWQVVLAQAEAQWLIANSGGKAKVVSLAFNGNTSGVVADQTIASTIAKCSGCSYYSVPLTLQQVNPQDITSLLQSALLRHPDANSAVAFVAALFELDGAQALKSSGRKITSVTSGSGEQLMGMVQSGLVTAVVATDFVWQGYAAADTLNRVFAGAPPVPEGLGQQLIYPGHGLPASGSYQFAGINYRADYQKLWTGS